MVLLSPVTKMIGIVDVVALAASAAGVLPTIRKVRH